MVNSYLGGRAASGLYVYALYDSYKAGRSLRMYASQSYFRRIVHSAPQASRPTFHGSFLAADNRQDVREWKVIVEFKDCARRRRLLFLWKMSSGLPASVTAFRKLSQLLSLSLSFFFASCGCFSAFPLRRYCLASCSS